MDKKLASTSKFISLVLRHKPGEIGLALDEHGWADVMELLQKAASAGIALDATILEHIVETNDKKRFSFSEDQTKIRANQGHSIQVDVQLKAMPPPQYLYHGTADMFVDEIMNTGINRRSRLHVHLSDNYATARNVGTRHGRPVILEVQAAAMHADGFEFYLSENKVWLVNEVPAKYIAVKQSN